MPMIERDDIEYEAFVAAARSAYEAREEAQPWDDLPRKERVRLLSEYRKQTQQEPPQNRAAFIARMHAHHALWRGLLEYGWSAETEAFGMGLANRIADAIEEDAAIPSPPESQP